MKILKEKGDFDVLGEACVDSIGSLIGSAEIGGIKMCDSTFNVFREEMNPNLMLSLGVDFLKNNGLEISTKRRKLIKYCDEEGSVELYLDKPGRNENAC